MITLCGSFDGHPVSVTVNPSLPQSLLSSQFALVANIPRTVSFGTGVIELSAQGPLRLPTPSGWYESRQRFLVAYVREHDVVLGSDWLRATQASVQTSTQASYLNDPHVPSGTMADGHAWVPSPSVVSDRFPLPRYTDDAAVASASTPDDGCKASSSHGLGSNMRVARADVPYNVAYAVSVVLPMSETQNVFGADATEEFIQSVSVTHGIHADNSLEIQKRLVAHILSGECASHSAHRPTGGCLQVAGTFPSAALLRDSIRSALAARALRMMLSGADPQPLRY